MIYRLDDEAYIEELVELVKSKGLKYPLVVKPKFSGSTKKVYVYEESELIPSLKQGIDLSAISEVRVEELVDVETE